MKPISGILETCLYVDDLATAERFYCDVLQLTLVTKDALRHVFLRCGDHMLLLFNADETSSDDSNLPQHGTRGSGHVAFSVSQEALASWQQRLEELGIEIEHVETWTTGDRSIYFRDPSGNSVELASPSMWFRA